jgi:hypothetical protein
MTKIITLARVENLANFLNKGDNSIRSNWNADQLLSRHLLAMLCEISNKADVEIVQTYFSKSEGEVAINKMDIVHKINVLRNYCNKNTTSFIVKTKSPFFVQLCYFLARDMEVNITN